MTEKAPESTEVTPPEAAMNATGPAPREVVLAWMRENARKGGLSRSRRKVASSRKSISKAQAARMTRYAQKQLRIAKRDARRATRAAIKATAFAAKLAARIAAGKPVPKMRSPKILRSSR